MSEHSTAFVFSVSFCFRLLNEIRRRLASLDLEAPRKTEIVKELSQHLDDRYADLCAGGATEGDPGHAALGELSQSDLLVQELKRVECVGGAE